MEQMTIKQLADRLGVSKTAIRKQFTDDFRKNHIETTANGVLTISPEGCKLIAEIMQRMDKLSETTGNNFAETTATTANITLPLAVWETFQAQLEEKDRQLRAKDEQIKNLTSSIANLTASLNAEQLLHGGTMKQALTATAATIEEDPATASPPEATAPTTTTKKSFWERLFKRSI